MLGAKATKSVSIPKINIEQVSKSNLELKKSPSQKVFEEDHKVSQSLQPSTEKSFRNSSIAFSQEISRHNKQEQAS